LQRLLLPVDVAKIVLHEVDDLNVLIDLLDPDALTREHRSEIDALAVHAHAPASADEELAVM
jgi:hypothetical protein